MKGTVSFEYQDVGHGKSSIASEQEDAEVVKKLVCNTPQHIIAHIHSIHVHALLHMYSTERTTYIHNRSQKLFFFTCCSHIYIHISSSGVATYSKFFIAFCPFFCFSFSRRSHVYLHCRCFLYRPRDFPIDIIEAKHTTLTMIMTLVLFTPLSQAKPPKHDGCCAKLGSECSMMVVLEMRLARYARLCWTTTRPE